MADTNLRTVLAFTALYAVFAAIMIAGGPGPAAPGLAQALSSDGTGGSAVQVVSAE